MAREEYPSRDTRENKDQWSAENTDITKQGAQPTERNENDRIRSAYKDASQGSDRDPNELKKNDRFGITDVDKDIAKDDK